MKFENGTSNTWRNNPEKIILFDNGAYEIKHSTASGRKYKKFHNCKFFEKTNNSSSLNSSAPFFIQDIAKDFPIENISTLFVSNINNKFLESFL